MSHEASSELRRQLALLFRALHRQGMGDLIYTHLSARDPDAPARYLLPPAGLTFEEITASGLVEVDLEDTGAAGVEDVAVHIHGGLYRARPDVFCIAHTHTVAGVAISAMEEGLLPISQHALMVIGELAYHDYGGLANPGEMTRMLQAVGRSACVILRNHGLLVLGESIPRAFKRLYYLEQACRIQVAASSSPGGLRQIPEPIRRKTIAGFLADRRDPAWGEAEWAAMVRGLR